MANYQGMIAGANNMAAQQRDPNSFGLPATPTHNQVMPNPTPVPGQPMAMPQIPRPQVPSFGATQAPDVRARIAQALAMRQQMNPNFNPAQFGFPNA